MESKKILTKCVGCIIVVCMLFAQVAEGQDTTQKKYDYYYQGIDSNLLMNKAKLLCISKSGVDDIDTTIHYVLSQKSELFHTTNKFYDIIVVKSNQFLSTQVKTKTGVQSHYCGRDFEKNLNCFYTLVFSYHTFKFYQLTGFAWSDIKELDDEMSKYYLSVYDIFSEELIKKLSIDFDCLAAKYLYREKKYKDKRCDKECGRCMEMAEVN